MKNIRTSVLAMGLASMCMVSGSALSVDNANPMSGVPLESQQNDSTYVDKIMNRNDSPSVQPVSLANQDKDLGKGAVSNKSKKLGINNYAGGALGILGTLAFGVQAVRYGIRTYELSKLDLSDTIDKFISMDNLPEWLKDRYPNVNTLLKSELYSVRFLQGLISGLCGVGSAVSACYAYKSLKGDIDPDLVELLRLARSLVGISTERS